MSVAEPLTPQAGEALVVMYHYVRDADRTPYPALNTLRISEFDAQLAWFAERWSPISYPQFEASCSGGELRPGAALLTFDDGFVDHYTAAFPMLRQRGWSGVFFVAGAALDDPPRLLNVHKTHFLLAALGAERFADDVQSAIAAPHVNTLKWQAGVYRYDESPDVAAKHLLNYEVPFEEADRVLSTLFERHIGDEGAFARELYLSRDMIREMTAAGMTLGFHSECHRVLSRLDREAQRRELLNGVSRLRVLTGQTSVPFCYPYGHPHTYNADTLAVLREAGYGMAFNTVRRLARPAVDPPFEIPRFDTRDLPPFTESVDA